MPVDEKKVTFPKLKIPVPDKSCVLKQFKDKAEPEPNRDWAKSKLYRNFSLKKKERFK